MSLHSSGLESPRCIGGGGGGGQASKEGERGRFGGHHSEVSTPYHLQLREGGGGGGGGGGGQGDRKSGREEWNGCKPVT